MNPERWATVECLFAAALERPEAERESLIRAEAADAEVVKEVLSLLEAHGEAGLFDPMTARQDAREAEDQLVPGQRAGAWEVIELLGRGGMGVVYRARRADGQFEQEAALKVLAREVPGAQSLPRFLAERQILARLSHPHIARLLDGGVTDAARPFYVMEYVDGMPIDAYCDAARLDVRDRLRLFLKVCDAVQSAHQSLVVHRDLKPANILVTPDGEPKLLDFGIAKLLDPDSPDGMPTLTRANAQVLTPLYASPEQLQGRTITTASDVFQLGLLLYVLLVGRHPYGPMVASPDGIEEALAGLAGRKPSQLVVVPPTGRTAEAGADETERAAARGTTPERLRRRLRGDLDDIVLKALRPEPDRRYGTAGQLADDIGRHLDGRPVRARPDTVTYRTGKFIRRHRLGLAAVAGAFLLLGGFAFGIQRQAERTATERDRAEEVLGFLVGVFGSADPYVAEGDTLTVRAVLGRGAARARVELAEQPAAQATLTEAIGQVYENLGMVDSAASLLETAVAARRRIPDGDEWTLRSALVKWGGLLSKAGRVERARPVLEEALALHRRIGRRGTAEYASILNDVGNAWQVQGDWNRAEPLLLEAWAEYRRLPAPTSGTVATLNNLGWLRISAEDPDSAASLFRRGLELRRAMGASDHDVALSLSSLAEALGRTGAVAAADSAVAEALRLERGYLPDDHPLIAGLLSLRAGLHGRDQPELAERLYREAIEIRSEAYGEDHWGVAEARNELALVLMDQGRGPEAVELFRQAEGAYRRQVGEEHVNTVIVELNLARLLFQLGETVEAEQRFAHAVPIIRRTFPEEPRYLEDQVSLGFLRCGSVSLEEGLEHLEPAAAGLRPPDGGSATNGYLRALNALGSCLADHGRAERASDVLQSSLAASRDRPEEDPYRVYARTVLERLTRTRGREGTTRR